MSMLSKLQGRKEGMLTHAYQVEHSTDKKQWWINPPETNLIRFSEKTGRPRTIKQQLRTAKRVHRAHLNNRHYARIVLTSTMTKVVQS